MKRRTQQERTENSRRKVIEATIGCIQKGGVTNATVSKIAAEAGVTWGVIQHQFGSKEGLFSAVLETASSELLERLESFSVRGNNIQEVVDEFAEVLWSHYSQPSFRATIEILLNSDQGLQQLEGRVQNIGLKVVSQWRRIVKAAGCKASDQVIGIAGEILETSLSGFAIRSLTFHQQRFNVKKRRQSLAEAVVYLLDGSNRR